MWKLGDIVYSSPKVQADYQYCSDGTSFNSQALHYDSRLHHRLLYHAFRRESLVFVGANDGMLHAFKTGTLTTTGLDSSQYQIAALTGIPTSDMGKELWAFIPKNSLPYLRCLAVPPPNSCHLYYNDLSPYITKMVSNKVTKTVLIGGMRLGAGAISSGKYCFNSSGVSNGQTCSQNSDCTTAPYNSSCSTTLLSQRSVGHVFIFVFHHHIALNRQFVLRSHNLLQSFELHRTFLILCPRYHRRREPHTSMGIQPSISGLLLFRTGGHPQMVRPDTSGAATNIT